MANTNVWDGSTLHVMESKCSTCIFHPGNRMHLEPGRVAEMVRDAKANESVIPCHHTIHGQRKQHAVCNGYYEAHGESVQAIQVITRLGLVTFDAVDEEEQS